MKKLLLSGTAVFLFFSSFSQISLVKDINTKPGSSDPFRFTQAGTQTFFTANTPEHGEELWRTDGTTAGTFMVKDIYPGSRSSDIRDMEFVNGILYFNACDGIHSEYHSELWRSDGTETGTYLLKDIYQGELSSDPKYFADINGVLFFSAYSDTGLELWKSDGTEAGTILVKDINSSGSGMAGSVISPEYTIYSLGGIAIFAATDNTHGHELWRSDGTSAGTFMIKDIKIGSGSGCYNFHSAGALVIGNVLYFVATDGTNGYELWKTDGTETGTVMVKDIKPGSGNGLAYATSTPTRCLTNINGTLFFVADNGINGREIWKSDGTETGTVMVMDIYPGSISSDPLYLTDVNNTLFLSADNGSNGRELWKSDGTTTVMVKDIITGPSSSNIEYLLNIGGTAYFRASGTSNGDELWKSDGTETGTAIVKDIGPGNLGSNPQYLFNANGMILFRAEDNVNGRELWSSTGTNAGTNILKNINDNNESSLVSSMTEMNGYLFFCANDDMTFKELWKSDGTESGTVFLKDINPWYSSPSELIHIDNKIYFSADDNIAGTELFVSDGTPSGTNLAKDIYSGNFGSYPVKFTEYNHQLFFNAKDPLHGAELWKSDGLSSGTVLVKDIYPGVLESQAEYRIVFNENLYFGADDGQNGNELWKTDGSETGTVLVKDLRAGLAPSSPHSFFEFNNELYFIAADESSWQRLWKSDGTGNGTVKFDPITSIPTEIAKCGSVFYLLINWELWKSDGTSSGTTKIKGGIVSPFDLKESNGLIYFTALDGGRRKLWKSDGTEEGTTIVTDLFNPRNLFSFNDKMHFVAFDGVTQEVIWETDGTTSGTKKVSNDTYSVSSEPNFTVMNDKLYFIADINKSGFELAEYVPLTTVISELPDNMDKFRLYPVPSSGTITIQNKNDFKTTVLTIFDVTGNKVLSKVISNGKSTIELNIRPGLYIYRVDTGLSSATGKLIIK